jgi:hypothetical protein
MENNREMTKMKLITYPTESDTVQTFTIPNTKWKHKTKVIQNRRVSPCIHILLHTTLWAKQVWEFLTATSSQ